MDEPKKFGVLSDGRTVNEYVLCNRHGVRISVLDYGGIIRSFYTPDRFGHLNDIVLGFDNLAQYEESNLYLGAIVGRVAGRVAGGRLNMNAGPVQLALNDPPNHLHGGARGFDKKLWQASYKPAHQSLELSYESPDGEEGYPGNLRCRVTYALSDANELTINYWATSDAPTVVNLTQHSYFNLSGNFEETVNDHTLAVNAERILELDEFKIPTGEALQVANSRFDFRKPRKISDAGSGGYDHFWVLNDAAELPFAAELGDEISGRRLQVSTTAPGLQIYTGNGLPQGLTGNRVFPMAQSQVFAWRLKSIRTPLTGRAFPA